MPPTVVIATGTVRTPGGSSKSRTSSMTPRTGRTRHCSCPGGRLYCACARRSAAGPSTDCRIWPRVLRIPGTANLKDPNNPKAVTLHSATDRRYNLSDFQDYLDDRSGPRYRGGGEGDARVGRSGSRTSRWLSTSARASPRRCSTAGWPETFVQEQPGCASDTT